MDKQPENKNSASTFLKTDGGKTKSNALETPSINLPKGGGAIKGIDEKFSVNAVNGTASFSIPIPVSQARGASPNLNLSYNSGAGNGIFGLGWSLNLPSIKRKTDKELPRYSDAIDSDTYLFSEAEDLVSEYKREDSGKFALDLKGNYIINEKDSQDGLFKIRFYKPRIEGLFARIERWLHKTTGEIKWRVITKENVTTLFGWSADSRIADPADAKRIFEWLPEIVFDDKGNCALYKYKPENEAGFNRTFLHNRNRFKDGDITYVNLYPEKIFYGNKTPYRKFGDLFPDETDFMFQTVFDFGEYALNAPYDEIEDWDFREDAFSEYKPGFEIRTTRLCRRILLYHFFDELPGGNALVRSLDFEYDAASERDFTFLKSVTSRGYIKQSNESYTSKSLPSIEFTYQQHDWNKEVKTVAPENLVHSPAGLADASYQFTDLFNEGLSGILTEQATGWYYKHNLGEGKFEQAKLVSPKPSFTGLGAQLQLADLDADGGKQIINYDIEPKGFFELNDENEWLPFKSFENLPNIDLNDSNARLVDLTGDGTPDVLITEDNVFTWYESSGRKGFREARKTVKSFDEETGPHIVFADSTQSIFLSDMSGDGLTDIVRIRNGAICYWSNLGYGKFGAKVSMDNAPVFDNPGSFNPALIRLADIDGSGTTDVIYLGKDKFSCWLNLSGNSFSETPFEIEAFPEIYNQASVTVTDLLGNGVACIVWSSHLEKHSPSPLRYIDLMNSKKPHIMVAYENNLGKKVAFEYAASTKFYIEDKLAGKPWITKLHFPVHCIVKTETRDTVSGFRFTSSYKYHHGYFDHAEREFRGFGMVEQTDSEQFEHWAKGASSNIVDRTLFQEPVVTKSWFHTGAFLGREKILNQFAHEYWYEEMERQGFSVTNAETPLPDARLIVAPGLNPAMINDLSAQEWREALRACKSMNLRSEIFANDAPAADATPEQLRKELTPFTVAAHNCLIELLQPKGQNKHAVFAVKESESVIYNYERIIEDPRIAHNLNIKLDEYGNVLESASIVYPRKPPGNNLPKPPDNKLPPETQDAQNETFISYVQNAFTNDIDEENNYRLRVSSEAKTYELKNVSKSGTLFAVSDFNNIPAHQKRLIEHIRTLFYSDNLTDALNLHELDTKGLPFESYQMAYSAALVSNIFGSKVDDALMLEGKFVHLEKDDNWWIRSGTTQFIENTESAADAEKRFYLPISYTDPYGAKTTVKYYSNYFLMISETEDALENKTKVLSFNLRALSPQRIQDANDNIAETIIDELGFVKAAAVFGKVTGTNPTEADDLTGINEFTSAAENQLINDFFNAPASDQLVTAGKDLLSHATARFVYDFDAYKNSGGRKPAVVASILREEHFQKNADSPVQISFEYSNGLEKVVMKKVQAEPGIAKKVIVAGDTYSVVETDTAAGKPEQLRWIGNGRTVLNNKGNPVKQYEPYFSVTHQYEDLKELVETGVTPVLYYDALDRMIKKEFPDGTFSKTEFDSWKQIIYDQNDTVKDSQWYFDRGSPDPNASAEPTDPEKRAAWLAAKHADTPSIQHLDTLGRPVLQIEHNRDSDGADVFYHTLAFLDIEGNLRKVSDARNNVVMRYKYDLLGNMVYQNSMDAGQRWLLQNIVGNALRNWDERNHVFSFEYDILHRPTVKKVEGGGNTKLNHIYENVIYGENQPADKQNNLRGQIAFHYDTAGLMEIPSYDFKGKPVRTTRKLAIDYKNVVNWDAPSPQLLEGDYTFVTELDALERITKQTAPDGSIIIPAYNRTGLFSGEKVGQDENGTIVSIECIKNITYNEKGQREKILYGNDVITRYFYDKETFRLIHLETKKPNENAPVEDPLQDWHYTFDPVGNITRIEDKNIPDIFFDNQKITGTSDYAYDALYRLTEAKGREHKFNAENGFGKEDNWEDSPFKEHHGQGDSLAWQNYVQQYSYDETGNILRMQHIAGKGSWTRDYDYSLNNNRLISTTIGGDTYKYKHHSRHGYITEMPHLQLMEWNFKEELQATARQSVSAGTPEITYYQYDARGERVRKITENSAAGTAVPTKKGERIYVSGYELYKKHSLTNAGLERHTLGLIDNGQRFVMIETRNNVDDGTDKKLVRYQLGNHLGSVAMEVDQSGRIISYEEFHPFGTTAYQASDKAVKAAAKRYRYTGMERDEESGLEYHSARYYVPWLGRWLSADPIHIINRETSNKRNHKLNEFNELLRGYFRLNPSSRFICNESNYSFCGNSPIKFTDKNGCFQVPTDIAEAYPSLDKMAIALSNVVNENPTISNPLIREFIIAAGLDVKDPNSVYEALQVLSYNSGPVIQLDASIDKVAFGEFREENPSTIFISKLFADELQGQYTTSWIGKKRRPTYVHGANKLIMFLTLWHEGIHYEDFCDDGVSQPKPSNASDLDIGSIATSKLFQDTRTRIGFYSPNNVRLLERKLHTGQVTTVIPGLSPKAGLNPLKGYGVSNWFNDKVKITSQQPKRLIPGRYIFPSSTKSGSSGKSTGKHQSSRTSSYQNVRALD